MKDREDIMEMEQNNPANNGYLMVADAKERLEAVLNCEWILYNSSDINLRSWERLTAAGQLHTSQYPFLSKVIVLFYPIFTRE